MTRGGRTPLTTRLRHTLWAHGEARRTGAPIEDVLDASSRRDAQAATAGLSRRDVLRAAGAAGVAGAATALGARPAHSAPAAAPSVAIVGAGLAGVRAAHWLWQVKGIRSTVYEGSDRAGGRCHSLRGWFSNGYVVEHGGSLINTDHNAIRNLASSLGLSMDTVHGGSYSGWVDKYWIDGADYPYDAANLDWGEVWLAMKDALKAAPYPQTFDSWTAAGRAIDDMTVDEWLAAHVPGGLASQFSKLMQSNVIAEYGLDPAEQSALNLVYLLGWNGQNNLAPMNGADEKYSVHGGNDQVVSRMIDELPPGTVQYGRRLLAVRTLPDGRVLLVFPGGRRGEVVVDRAILALPFTTLRECDLTQSGFSALKLQTIDELGLGYNAKIHVEVSHRPWVEQGYGGACYTNWQQFQCGWDDTADQPLPGGVFNLFPGGSQVSMGWSGDAFGPAPADQVAAYLAQAEPIFPGITGAYTGRSYRDFWYANPWSRGAYTAQRPGQYTRLFGSAAVPEGHVHFAGEHTSVSYYGFLNGAVESGERAAKEVALS